MAKGEDKGWSHWTVLQLCWSLHSRRICILEFSLRVLPLSNYCSDWVRVAWTCFSPLLTSVKVIRGSQRHLVSGISESREDNWIDKHLSCKHENMRLISRTHLKKKLGRGCHGDACLQFPAQEGGGKWFPEVCWLSSLSYLMSYTPMTDPLSEIKVHLRDDP